MTNFRNLREGSVNSRMVGLGFSIIKENGGTRDEAYISD